MTEVATRPCSSCKAPIILALTRGGSLSPFDAEPSPSGRWLLAQRQSTGKVHATYANVDARREALASGRNLYVTHFATCPNAEEHRR